MDHKVSKDMISSGMIPSGEKTQADLSRTQYGSAPSPSKLLDAYKKMYEHHQKDKDGNTIPHEDDVKEGKEEGGYISNVSKAEVRNQRRFDKKGSGEPTGTFGQGTSEKAKLAVKRGEEHKERRGQKTGAGGYTPGATTEEVDVFDTVVNHFLNEGYQREDIIKAMSTVHLTEEQLLQEDFGISAIIAGTAAALKAGAALAGKAAVVGGKAAAAAGKAGMAAAKGVGGATKAVATAAKPVVGAATKGLTNVGTKVGQTVGKASTKISQTAGKVSQKVADTTSNVGQQIKKVSTTAKDTVGQKIQNIAQGTKTKPKITSSGGKIEQGVSKPQTPQQKTAKDRVIEFGKKKGEEEIMKDRPLNKTNKTGTASAGQTDIAASTDLFDIVKGRLLDEGLSEEEIKDIMLSLTPDEIMEELSDTVKRNDALNRERAIKAAQERKVPQDIRDKAKKQYKAGTPRENPNDPYTKQDAKDIRDYYNK